MTALCWLGCTITHMTYASVKANPFFFLFFFHFYGTITECKANASKSHSLAPTCVGPVRLTTKTHSGIFTAACRLIEYFQILEKKFKCIKCMSRQFHLHLLGGSRPVILKYTQTSLSISSRFALSNNSKQTRNSFQSPPKHTKSSTLSSELL